MRTIVVVFVPITPDRTNREAVKSHSPGQAQCRPGLAVGEGFRTLKGFHNRWCNPYRVETRSLNPNPGWRLAATPLRLPWAMRLNAFSVRPQAVQAEQNGLCELSQRQRLLKSRGDKFHAAVGRSWWLPRTRYSLRYGSRPAHRGLGEGPVGPRLPRSPARCSSRMRRTSRIASGWQWTVP